MVASAVLLLFIICSLILLMDGEIMSIVINDVAYFPLFFSVLVWIYYFFDLLWCMQIEPLFACWHQGGNDHT